MQAPLGVDVRLLGLQWVGEVAQELTLPVERDVRAERALAPALADAYQAGAAVPRGAAPVLLVSVFESCRRLAMRLSSRLPLM